LHPEIPEQGLTLEELFRGRGMDIPGILSGLKKRADDLTLPWAGMEKTYNTRLAQEAGKWAEERGKGEKFHKAVFHAYFAEGENIANREVLVALAGRIGLPEAEAMNAMESGRFGPAVDDDWALSRELSIRAVPTFVLDQDRLVGAQPYAQLEQFMRKHGVPETSSIAKGVRR
jgi:predicted DsbA family dithiol-disulfide isomerase